VVRERKAPGRQFYGQTRNLRPRLSRCDCVSASPPSQFNLCPFAFSVGAVEMSKLYAIVATTKEKKE